MDGSPLGRLPAELRNIIYQDALHEPDGVEISTQPGLLYTCKTIRMEAELMYYAINDFVIHLHEDRMNHNLCRWLRRRAGPRTRLLQNLTIHCQMPSIATRSANGGTAESEDIDDDSHLLSFLQLMHLMASIRQAPFQKNLASLVRFTLNDAKDDISLQTVENMPFEDQDRHRGAKFLIVCLVHGEQSVMNAMEDGNTTDQFEKLDKEIRECRALDRGAGPLNQVAC